MDKINVFLINNITEYGKLIAYCIQNDISVFRTYWDETAKGRICYHIDFKMRRCFYSNIDYFERSDMFNIIIPEFGINAFGSVILKNKKG